ncbi:unnamed protein product [Rotaria sp. Silwood1]|nr:unnamed protein product [Rotaria sp. Silwood1]CAF4917409.1 unnamed protein product [Rotaria sp. Silwood1]
MNLMIQPVQNYLQGFIEIVEHLTVWLELEIPSYNDKTAPRRMSTAQADGSLWKMTSSQKRNSDGSIIDSYTQAIINRDESEQRKQDGSSGFFLTDNQKHTELTDTKDKTNKQ